MRSQSSVVIPDVPLFFICGCCKQTLDEDSVSIHCPNCNERVCEPSASCQALCKCDRTLRGRITQLWFRKSNEVYVVLTKHNKKVE